MCRAGRPSGVGDVDPDLFAPHAADRLHGRTSLADQRGGVLWREEEREAHPAIVGDRQVPNHARGEKVVVEARIPDGGEGGDNPGFEGVGH